MYDKAAILSVAELFEVKEADSVWDAWLTTVSLLDILEHTHRLGDFLDFENARDKIAKVYAAAEAHWIDRNDSLCTCGLSDAEHRILKRKMITFFRLQVSSLKLFLC